MCEMCLTTVSYAHESEMNISTVAHTIIDNMRCAQCVMRCGIRLHFCAVGQLASCWPTPAPHFKLLLPGICHRRRNLFSGWPGGAAADGAAAAPAAVRGDDAEFPQGVHCKLLSTELSAKGR